MAGKRKRSASQQQYMLNERLLEACQAGAPSAELQSLVREGAFAFVQDEAGWTALHYAAARNDAELVEWLLANGAVWNIVDHSHFTAADIAFSSNNARIYDMLVNEGVRQEILKRILDADEEHPLTAATDNGTFLGTKLLFRGDGDQEVCFDSDGNGVMMGWETGIMQESARLLCQDHPNAANGLTVVNIGHGLGIIDEALHAFRPTRHIIVEAHPDVLQRMREKGWYDWPGVEVYEGRWQDWLESEPGLFDAIYWDTFSEHYKDLHQFLDSLLNLLAEDGRFSFFHGLGADNRCFYDVYTAVSEYHLRDCRLEVEWHDVPVKTKAITWEGVAYQYWKLSIDYRLPLCKAMTGP